MLHHKIRSLLQLQELLDENPDNDLLEQLKTDPAKAIREITALPEKEEFSKYKLQSIQQLDELMESEPRLIDILKHDPVSFIKHAVREAPAPEYKIYRILVSSLCAVVLIIILGVLAAWFTKNSREAPTLITAIACTTLGMLAGMFVYIPGKRNQQKEINRNK